MYIAHSLITEIIKLSSLYINNNKIFKNIISSRNYSFIFIIFVNNIITIPLENKKKCDLKLKSLIIKCVDEWDTKFSSNYPKLASSIKFVKQKKQVHTKFNI